MEYVLLDTSQIQRYVFGSSRLRENVGASYLAARCIEDIPLGLLPAGAASLDELAAGSHRAMVLYAGGGNLGVLFSDADDAREFVRSVSREILVTAPGLSVAAVTETVNSQADLAAAAKRAFDEALPRDKAMGDRDNPVLGLGVTAACRSTGMPAVGRVTLAGESRRAGAEVIAKFDAATPNRSGTSQADEQLSRTVPPPEGWAYPSELDDLGGTGGEHNYIAVVHIDGNSISGRIKDLAAASDGHGELYARSIGEFSAGMTKAVRGAMKHTVDALARWCVSHYDSEARACLHRGDNGAGREVARLSLDFALAPRWLPLRPLIMAGDDITFVCDGRVGLSLAILYLKSLEELSADLEGGALTGCAGVAIAKTHHPFYRVYSTAEELCREAKSFRAREGLSGSCLDWHFTTTGLHGSLAAIRDREYATSSGHLTQRPVSLHPDEGAGLRTWGVVEKAALEFQSEDWLGKRNKQKALREALRQGTTGVEWFAAKFLDSGGLPEIAPGTPDLNKRAWYGDRCFYYDALELADWYIPIGMGGE